MLVFFPCMLYIVRFTKYGFYLNQDSSSSGICLMEIDYVGRLYAHESPRTGALIHDKA